MTDGLNRLTGGGEHLAQLTAGPADEPHRVGLARPDEGHDVAAAGRRVIPSAVSLRARALPEATASTQPWLPQWQTDVGVVADLDVAQVAGRALSPAVDLAAGDHTGSRYRWRP